MMSIRLAEPLALIALVILPVIIYLLLKKGRERKPRMRFSSLKLIGTAGRTLRTRMRPLPVFLFMSALTLMIVALARPQSPWRDDKRKTEGISIMLVIDVSESMRALDFEPNRMVKAKQVVKEFVKGRKDDLIGLVIFGKETFTLCPLTHDYAALETFIDRIDFDLVDGNATAIGLGLANGVNKLKDAPTKSKVAILLTDGENNAGEIQPMTAAEIAKKLAIRVYTIGVGSQGVVQIPVRMSNGREIMRQMMSSIDEESLGKIAEMTDGQFFMATDGRKLEQIWKQIDTMERTKVDVNEKNYFDELAPFLLIPALLLFGLAFFLEQTWLWSFP